MLCEGCKALEWTQTPSGLSARTALRRPLAYSLPTANIAECFRRIRLSGAASWRPGLWPPSSKEAVARQAPPPHCEGNTMSKEYTAHGDSTTACAPA